MIVTRTIGSNPSSLPTTIEVWMAGLDAEEEPEDDD